MITEHRRAYRRVYREANKDSIQAYQKAYRISNRTRAEQYRIARRWKFVYDTYGLTREQYEHLLSKQSGVCAICHQPPASKMLCVDHAHDETLRVRGLLCHSCNVALGHMKDDPRILASGIEYLKRT